MMKRKIKKFGMEGKIADDKHFPQTRENYQRMVEDQMRTAGYVPVLDIEPQFFTMYFEDNDTYSFIFNMYGVYVGKRKSLDYEGFSGQSFLPRKK